MRHSIIFILALLLIGTSCNKDPELDIVPQTSSTVDFRNRGVDQNRVVFKGDFLQNHLALFETELRYYRGNGRSAIQDFAYMPAFQEAMSAEQAILEQMGFAAYVDQNVETGDLDHQTADMMKFVYASMDTGSEIDVSVAMEELQRFRPASEEEDLYWYVYNVIQGIYSDFLETHPLDFRGDCDFQDFVQHILEASTTGNQIGEYTTILWQLLGWEVWEIELAGVTIEVPSGLVGSTVGAIVGLITYDDDSCEDCGTPQHLSVDPDDNCDLTNILRVTGAGSDVGVYEWSIANGNEVGPFTTTTNTLEVTQEDPNVPLRVEVRALCEDGLSAPLIVEEVNLSTAENNPLGQVGDVNLLFFGCDNVECFGSGPTSVGRFNFSAANGASGLIDVSFSISPSNMAAIVFQNEYEAHVDWLETGEATATVTALNTCSGLTETRTLTLKIKP